MVRRCAWSSFSDDPLMLRYHDEEWGVPLHRDRTLFEFLILEGAQAGLSWQTILNKRENYRKAFNKYVWGFVDGKPIKHGFTALREIPATTKESNAMSKDLRKRGFSFVGPTICDAFMQAVGMVNDHTRD